MENTNNIPQNDSGHMHENGMSEATSSANMPGEVQDDSGRYRIIKIALIVAILLVVAGLLYTFKGLFVAAIVNGHPITRYTVIKELERQGGKDALENLIDRQLIKQEAAAQHITISDDDVNKQIKNFEDQYNTGGQTLDSALEAENLTRDDLRQQIIIRLEIEKMLGDKANVTDEEVNKYITDNKVAIQQGQEDETKAAIKDQLHQQKLADQSQQLLNDLRTKAKIRDFVNYKGGSAQGS